MVGKSAGNRVDAVFLQETKDAGVFRIDDGDGTRGKNWWCAHFPAGIQKQIDCSGLDGWHWFFHGEDAVGRMGQKAGKQSAEIWIGMFADDLDQNHGKLLISAAKGPVIKKKGCAEAHP